MIDTNIKERYKYRYIREEIRLIDKYIDRIMIIDKWRGRHHIVDT